MTTIEAYITRMQKHLTNINVGNFKQEKAEGFFKALIYEAENRIKSNLAMESTKGNKLLNDIIKEILKEENPNYIEFSNSMCQAAINRANQILTGRRITDWDAGEMILYDEEVEYLSYLYGKTTQAKTEY